MIDFRFWKQREKFLVLEILPERTTALFLSVDQDNVLRIDEEKHGIGPKEMAAYLKVHRAKQNIIIAADSSYVVTTTLPVHIDRANRDEPITAVELENLLSKAIAQVFNQCRAEASRELGIDELDAILVNSQVVAFRIDGHRVLNPIGFSVKTIDAVLDLTLTTRDVFERLRTLLKSYKSFFFTEMSRSALVSLEKVVPTPITFVSLGAERSNYFVMQQAAVGYRVRRSELVWRTSRFRELLADEFGVNHRTAQDLYGLYQTDGLSPSAHRHFEKLMKPGMLALLAELKVARLRGTIYMDTDEFLPVAFPLKNGPMTLVDPPLKRILRTVGLGIELEEWGKTPGQVLKRLAPFLEFYFSKNNSQINEWLKRHLNWLGAPV